jgi:hypothetical protein
MIEVVSKPLIRSKGPPKADYISNLKKIKVCIKRQADPPSPFGLWRDRSGKRSPPMDCKRSNGLQVLAELKQGAGDYITLNLKLPKIFR